MSRPGDLLRRAASDIGLTAVVGQRRQLDALAVAVDENSRLAGLLEQQVAELERSLVPMLLADQRARRR